MTIRINFTKPSIEAIKPSMEGKRVTVHDARTPGLICLIYPSGVRTFFVLRKLNGRTERIKIGVFPTISIEQARKKAAVIHAAIATDSNPAAVKRAMRAEPTFGEVFREFIRKKRNRAGKPLSVSTVSAYEVTVRTHLASICSLKLSQVTPDRLRALRIKSPAQNNRVKAIISSVFNWAEVEGITSIPNPAKAIKGQFIKSRERFLLPDEIPRFFAAVENSPLKDFWLLAIFTGARKGNLTAMSWADLDLNQAIWTIPLTKNGDAQRVPLVPEAAAILKARKSASVMNAHWVFPGHRSRVTGQVGHMVDPKKSWAKVCKDAGFSEPLRIHDLRRTLGSWQARAGASLTVIGKSLGHKSLQATQIYSRLDLDPIRSSVEQAVTSMLNAGRK